MEIKYTKDSIELDKVLNSLDKLVIDFTRVLNELRIKYVIISGYVAILFGRSRSSEDIDLFIERIEFPKFKSMWDLLYKRFECLATDDAKAAYNDYLKENHAIRFSIKGVYVPNIEIKFPKLTLDNWSIENRKKIVLNKEILYASPIELQIAFKLRLGSDKDFEDAQHLYETFKEKLDTQLLNHFLIRLNVEEVFERELK